LSPAGIGIELLHPAMPMLRSLKQEKHDTMSDSRRRRALIRIFSI
jgi:hypothetical protein